MAKYLIEADKAYMNILVDGDPENPGSGPRLVKRGAKVDVADDTIPGKWMRPLDAAARAAVKRRDDELAARRYSAEGE